jgi:hypothetical protein
MKINNEEKVIWRRSENEISFLGIVQVKTKNTKLFRVVQKKSCKIFHFVH